MTRYSSALQRARVDIPSSGQAEASKVSQHQQDWTRCGTIMSKKNNAFS